MKTTKYLLAILIAVALFAVGCGGSDDTAESSASEPTSSASQDTSAGDDEDAPATSGDPVRVGAAHDLSGPIGPFGTDMVRGGELAVEQFNSADGCQGRPIELVTEDLASDRSVMASAVRKLAEDGVIAIHGSTSSTALVVGAPVAAEEEIVLLPPGSQEAFGDDILNDWVFRIAPVTADALPGVLDQMQQVSPFSRLAIFYDPANNASVDDADLLQEYAADHGFEVVAVETAEEGATDFSSQISNITAAEPDAIWLSHLVEENAGFMIQARERGLDQQFFGGATFTNPEIFEIAGEAGDGAISYVPFLASADRTATAEFVAAFTEFDGNAPNSFNAYGYDAMTAILMACNDVGPDRTAIRDALGSMSFDGATSTITWDGPGDNTTPQVVLIRVEDAQFIPAG